MLSVIHPHTELIETMRLHRAGLVPLLALHLKRLEYSAQTLGYPYQQNSILQALQPYFLRRYTQPQRLRLTLGRTGKITVQCQPLAETAQPVRLALSPLNPLAPAILLQHKTTQRQHWAQGERWLQQHPSFFDVIYFDQNQQITEGGRSNIYILKNNRWVTPSLKQPLLAGVQRQYLLDQGWVSEKDITKKDLLHAPRIRISNALRGWLDARLDHF